MSIIHVSLAFVDEPDPDLDEFAANVVIKMTGNLAFPTPKVSMASLGAGQVAFHNALAGQTQGGTAATAIKNTARTALITLLRTEAIDVEITSAGNLATLLSSGYKQRPLGGSSSPLNQTGILAVTNNASTQLMLKLLTVPNAKSYEIQTSVDGINWVHVLTTTKTGNVIVENLKPGTFYYIRARAVGGSTGFGNWSDAISHMAT